MSASTDEHDWSYEIKAWRNVRKWRCEKCGLLRIIVDGREPVWLDRSGVVDPDRALLCQPWPVPAPEAA